MIPSRLFWMLTATIRPRLTYGSVLWAHKATATMIEFHTKVQRKALTSALHALDTHKSNGSRFWASAYGPFLQEVSHEVVMKTWLPIQPLLKSNWDDVGDRGTVVRFTKCTGNLHINR